MDFTILTPLSSSSALPRLLLLSPLNPNPENFSLSHRRCRVSAQNQNLKVDPSIFIPQKEVSGPKSAFAALRPIVLAAAALVVGFGIGGSRVAGIGGVAVVRTVGAVVVFVMNGRVPDFAAAELRNFVAGMEDPAQLRREDVDGIVQKYGMDKENEAFRAELCDLYNRFVNSVIPPGAENLKGDEVEMIIKFFKSALGFDDLDATSVYMEV